MLAIATAHMITALFLPYTNAAVWAASNERQPEFSLWQRTFPFLIRCIFTLEQIIAAKNPREIVFSLTTCKTCNRAAFWARVRSPWFLTNNQFTTKFLRAITSIWMSLILCKKVRVVSTTLWKWTHMNTLQCIYIAVDRFLPSDSQHVRIADRTSTTWNRTQQLTWSFISPLFFRIKKIRQRTWLNLSSLYFRRQILLHTSYNVFQTLRVRISIDKIDRTSHRDRNDGCTKASQKRPLWMRSPYNAKVVIYRGKWSRYEVIKCAWLCEFHAQLVSEAISLLWNAFEPIKECIKCWFFYGALEQRTWRSYES